jgi:chromosome segregation ATPase
MPIYYDEDGNEINLEKPIDEIQKGYQEQTQQFEEFKKTKEEELTAINEKLSKLENKDFNFKSLRDLTEEQQAKLSETEKMLMNQAEKHSKEIEEVKKSFFGNAKEEILDKLVGDNIERRQKVMEAYDSLNLKDDTKADIESKIRAAMKLSLNDERPVLGDNLYGGIAPTPDKVSDVKPEVKELGKNLGLSDEDFKKYSK